MAHRGPPCSFIPLRRVDGVLGGFNEGGDAVIRTGDTVTDSKHRYNRAKGGYHNYEGCYNSIGTYAAYGTMRDTEGVGRDKTREWSVAPIEGATQ